MSRAGNNIEKQTISTRQVEVSEQLQSQIDALKEAMDALTASNTALKKKVTFLLSYKGLARLLTLIAV